MRGLLFGIGGAILGLVIYAGFGIVTGLMLGYISLAVGYIVGKAIMKGTNGIGGRRYQIAAMALTYAAVSLSVIPIGISQIIQETQRNETSDGQAASGAPSDSGSFGFDAAQRFAGAGRDLDGAGSRHTASAKGAYETGCRDRRAAFRGSGIAVP
ncbi:MAG TPA: hypothetical protein VGG58_07155 [Candidatus Acidoferrum sp.]